MGLDTISNNGTRMVGPLIGGGLLQVVGVDGAYMLAAAVLRSMRLCRSYVAGEHGLLPSRAPQRVTGN